jgi:hypothetical protein
MQGRHMSTVDVSMTTTEIISIKIRLVDETRASNNSPLRNDIAICNRHKSNSNTNRSKHLFKYFIYLQFAFVDYHTISAEIAVHIAKLTNIARCLKQAIHSTEILRLSALLWKHNMDVQSQ